MKAKFKPQKVLLLRFSSDRTIEIVKALKYKNNVLIYNGKRAYLRGYNANDGFKIYVNNRLKEENGNEILLEDIYKDYFDFCNEYRLPIMPIDQFLDKLSKIVEIKGDKVVDVAFDNKIVNVNHDSDVYIFKKGRKKIPVYVTIDGVPSTVTFDTLKGGVVNSNGEIVAFDDETLASVISEATTMGATFGTQKLFWDLKLLVIMAIIVSAIALYVGFQNSMMLNKVVKMLETVL